MKYFAKTTQPFNSRVVRLSGVSVNQGFTLIEVMLAITIMAIISIAIINVFRVATDSYKAGNRESQVLQRSRYLFDSLENDLLNIFYLDEDKYNVTGREGSTNFTESLLKKEDKENNDSEPEDPNAPIYCSDDPEDKKKPNYVGNPSEEFVLIDLQMIGSDGSDFDRIDFSTQGEFELGEPYYPFGLKRITYNVDGGLLIRTEDTVRAAKIDCDGNVLEKNPPPTYTIVAEGVEQFQLTYCFWVDNTWYEVDNWDSTSKSLRNSKKILGDYKDTKTQSSDSATDAAPDAGDTGTDAELDLEDDKNEPYDGLPAYIRITATLKDPDDEKGRKISFSRLFQVPGAIETWVSNEKLTEDDRENEVILRKDEYTEVFPGALKKR